MNVANVGGNMIVTNSNMAGAGMLGSGIINNVNKQLPTLMGNNHHPTAPHHPHAQVSFIKVFSCSRNFAGKTEKVVDSKSSESQKLDCTSNR